MSLSKFFNDEAKFSLLTVLCLSVLFVQIVSFHDGKQCHLINKVPFKIKKPGKYCLAQDLYFNRLNGRAIKIASDSVTLDLDGHTLHGLRDSKSQAIAIYAENRSNITIRNGCIEGFLMGILIDSQDDLKNYQQLKFSQNITLSNLRLLYNFYRGMRVEANGSLIKNNYVAQTGGAEITKKDGAIGIETYGPGAMIVKNFVYDTQALGERGEAVGISSSFYGFGSIIDSNYISNYQESPRSIGIWTGANSSECQKTKVIVSRNTVSNMTSSILSSVKDITFKNNLLSNTDKYCRSDRLNYYNDPNEYLAFNE